MAITHRCKHCGKLVYREESTRDDDDVWDTMCAECYYMDDMLEDKDDDEDDDDA